MNRAKRIERGEAVEEEQQQQQVQPQECHVPVLGSGPEPRKVRPIKSTPEFPNPPYVVHSLYNVSRCQGCPEKINSSLPAPHDLFFRMKAVRPYQNKETLVWHDKVANAYFHLNTKCLQKFDPNLKLEDITMTKYPEFGNLLEWYYARRFHLFPAFRDGLHSGLNLAEVGNAQWKPKHKMSLVSAAKDDITTMLQQESDLKRFSEGSTFNKGKVLTDQQRATQERRQQMEQARSFAQVLQNPEALQMQIESEQNPDFFIPRSGAGHKPTKKTKGVEGRLYVEEVEEEGNLKKLQHWIHYLRS